MSKYRLPCECGKGIVIDASQAGQRIACECGAVLEVPTLRGVRALEPVQASASASRPAADWDFSRGLIFAGSIILIVIGAGVAWFGYEGLRAAPKITREDETKSFDKAIDELPPEEVYTIWKDFRDRGLGARGQNSLVEIRNFRAGRQRILAIGLALGAGGMLGAIGATLGRRKTSA